MSFRWDALDERQRKARDQEVALKDYLRQQNEQDKARKLLERRNELDQYRKITQIGNVVPVEKPINQPTANLTPPPVLDKSSIQPTTNEKLKSFPQDNSETFFGEYHRFDAHKEGLAALVGKVERLTEKTIVDDIRIREISSKILDSDRVLQDLKDQVNVKQNIDAQKTHQVISELLSKQTRAEQAIQEQQYSNKELLAQLNQMKYNIDSYFQRSEQMGSQLHQKTNELELDTKRSLETCQVVKHHDAALSSLYSTLGSNSMDMSRKMDSGYEELRNMINASSSYRQNVEIQLKQSISEVQRNFAIELSSKTDTLLLALKGISDNLTVTASKFQMDLNSQSNMFNKNIEDIQLNTREVMRMQKKELDIVILNERQVVKDVELRLQGAIEQNFQALNSTLARNASESRQDVEELKKSLGQIGKVLQDSVLVCEKSFSLKLKNLEDIVRAEIKSRMELDDRVNAMGLQLKQILETNEKVGQKQLLNMKEEQELEHVKMSDAIKKSLENHKGHIQKALSAAENEMKSLFLQFQSVDAEVKKLRNDMKNDKTKVEKNLSEHADEIQARIQEINIKSEQKFEQVSGKVSSLGNTLTALSDSIRERALADDSNIELLHKDINLKCSESSMLELKTEMATINDSLSILKSTILHEVYTKKQIDSTYVNRAEFVQDHFASKADIYDFEKTLASLSAEFGIFREEATRDMKKHLNSDDLAKLERLDVKSAEVTNDIAMMKNKIIDFVTKGKLSEEMENIESKISRTTSLGEEIEASMRKISSSLSEKVSVSELHGTSKYINTRLSEIDRSVVKLQESLSMSCKGLKELEMSFDRHSEELNSKTSIVQDLSKKFEGFSRKSITLEAQIKKCNENNEFGFRKLADTLDVVQQDLQGRSNIFNEKIMEILESLTSISEGQDLFQEDVNGQLAELVSDLNQVKEDLGDKCSRSSVDDCEARLNGVLNDTNVKLDHEIQLVQDLRDLLGKYDENLNSGLESNNEKIAKSHLDFKNQIQKVREHFMDAISDIKAKKAAESQNFDFQQALTKVEGEISLIRSEMERLVTQSTLENAISDVLIRIKSETKPIASGLSTPELSARSIYKPAQIFRRVSSQNVDENLWTSAELSKSQSYTPQTAKTEESRGKSPGLSTKSRSFTPMASPKVLRVNSNRIDQKEFTTEF